MAAGHVDAVTRLFGRLSEQDVTFVKEDVRDPGVIASWAQPDRPGRRWVALDDKTAVGFVALLPLVGWSAHVGELRLLVDPAHRGQGIGGQLVRHALQHGMELGLCKVTVEVVAVQQPVIDLFTRLGFQGEALLRDHIRDRHGDFQDVLLLAHFADESWSAMENAGIADELRG